MLTSNDQKLKLRTEVNQDLFVGKVLALNGEPTCRGTMEGEATLILLLDDQQIKTKAFLESDFYLLACDAHKHNQYVRISAILCEKPRYSDLKDVTLFEILR